MCLETSASRAAQLKAVWAVLCDRLPVVVTSHMRQDGDGIGSALAVRHALAGCGVEAHVALQPPVPGMFGFLPGSEQIVHDARALPAAYNLAVVDCGAFDRIGELSKALTGRVQTVNIDHHATNELFGDANCVDGAASSSGEIIYEMLAAAGAPITPQIAECLLTAVVSDTGQLSHQDTTPRAFAVCGACVAAGARPHEVVRRLFASPTPAQVRLKQLAMGTLRFHYKGLIATMDQD